MKVGDRVKFDFSDCCLEVRGEGVVTAIVVDGEDDKAIESIEVNGITIGGGQPTNWWQEAWREMWEVVE